METNMWTYGDTSGSRHASWSSDVIRIACSHALSYIDTFAQPFLALEGLDQLSPYHP